MNLPAGYTVPPLHYRQLKIHWWTSSGSLTPMARNQDVNFSFSWRNALHCMALQRHLPCYNSVLYCVLHFNNTGCIYFVRKWDIRTFPCKQDTRNNSLLLRVIQVHHTNVKFGILLWYSIRYSVHFYNMSSELPVQPCTPVSKAAHRFIVTV